LRKRKEKKKRAPSLYLRERGERSWKEEHILPREGERKKNQRHFLDDQKATKRGEWGCRTSEKKKKENRSGSRKKDDNAGETLLAQGRGEGENACRSGGKKRGYGGEKSQRSVHRKGESGILPSTNRTPKGNPIPSQKAGISVKQRGGEGKDLSLQENTHGDPPPQGLRLKNRR